MATNSLERAIEKQRREAAQQARDAAQHARDAATQNRASQIVAGQPIIGNMRIMDASSEEMLRVILDQNNGDPSQELRGNYDVFPKAYHMSMKMEFEKLSMYGMITTPQIWISGMWELYITPAGLSYFENKEKALEAEKVKQQTIPNIFAPGSNIVIGDVTNSTLSIDNSITKIEQLIDEKGGEDTAELKHCWLKCKSC